MRVILVDALHQILAIAHRRIERRAIAVGTARQAFNDLIHSGIEEEGQRVTVAAGAVGDPVRRRLELVVRPARRHVRDVEDEGARYGGASIQWPLRGLLISRPPWASCARMVMIP